MIFNAGSLWDYLQLLESGPEIFSFCDSVSLLIKVSRISSHHKVSSVLSLNPRLTKHKHFYGNAFVDEDSEGHAGRGCKVNSAISSD